MNHAYSLAKSGERRRRHGLVNTHPPGMMPGGCVFAMCGGDIYMLFLSFLGKRSYEPAMNMPAMRKKR